MAQPRSSFQLSPSHPPAPQICKEKGIEKVSFDRAGYRYHGRVAALANAAREGGLVF
jgi:hypothetical protein